MLTQNTLNKYKVLPNISQDLAIGNRRRTGVFNTIILTLERLHISYIYITNYISYIKNTFMFENGEEKMVDKTKEIDETSIEKLIPNYHDLPDDVKKVALEEIYEKQNLITHARKLGEVYEFGI
jgi:hypothetical protein